MVWYGVLSQCFQQQVMLSSAQNAKAKDRSSTLDAVMEHFEFSILDKIEGILNIFFDCGDFGHRVQHKLSYTHAVLFFSLEFSTLRFSDWCGYLLPR